MLGSTINQLRNLAWWKKSALLSCAILLLLLLGPAIGFIQSFFRENNPPDAILVLGGSYYTEQAAAAAALEYAGIPIVVSSGRARPCTYYVFTEEARIPWSRVVTDYRATDTLTNFTSTLAYMEEWDVEKVLVVTTEEHWQRAKHLAFFVFESAGIAVEARTYRFSGVKEERDLDIVLDSMRAAWWALFGDLLTPVAYTSEEEMMRQLEQREAGCQFGKYRMPADPYAVGSALVAHVSSSEAEQALLRGDRFRFMQLINQGVSPNGLTATGEPLLSVAIRFEKIELVKFLIEKGASLYKSGTNGRRPIDELSAHPAVLAEISDVVEAESAVRARSQSEVLARAGDAVEQSSAGHANAELRLIDAIEVNRYASGAIATLNLSIENTSEATQHGISVSARFGAGMLERLQGPEEITAQDRAEFSVSLRESSLYSSLGEIQINCQSCSLETLRLAQFQTRENN